MTNTGGRFPELAGRSVVITGASRGIGLGIARAFAAEGARLHLVADDPAVTSVAGELGATAALADITRPAEVAAALAGCGSIDVLVNNAGMERLTPLDDPACIDTVRRILDVNVTGTFIVTQAALPKMTQGARILITASTWSRSAEALFGAYVASKHALIGLIKTWARELGPRAVTVNGVAPGWVRTESALRSLAGLAARNGQPERDILQDILAGQAMPGLLEPADVAGPFLFLASHLGANVTGQTIGIDRGEVPW